MKEMGQQVDHVSSLSTANDNISTDLSKLWAKPTALTADIGILAVDVVEA